VTLEIGYYSGDLPATILDMLRDTEATPLSETSRDVASEKRGVAYWFGGTQTFLMFNENAFYEDRLLNRSEWVAIPYTSQSLKGERILRLDADGVRIPYLEQERAAPRQPDLDQCTQIEMKFKTTASGFFFPYVDEQSLLSSAEQQYLRSLQTIVIKDRAVLDSIADEVAEGMCDALVADHGAAELTCHCTDGRVISLTVYDCSYIVDQRGQVFKYLSRLPSLRTITPQVRGLDLRARCASQLEDLWYRLRTHHKNKTYPAPRQWCDDILVSPKPGVGRQDVFIPLFCCPTQPQGRSHYAMNPDCKYDSPPDMVLLFEAKPGWNQHGGPELFSFDNHDPKGGLVLLNDGTMKFIRTEEELKQLRWK